MDIALILRALRVLAIAVAGYGVLVFFAQRALAFPGQFRTPFRAASTSVPEGVRQVWLETSFGRVEAWHLVPPLDRLVSSVDDTATGSIRPYPALIYTHGNGELIDDWNLAMRPLVDEGVSVLLLEFPGYGFSAGRPTRKSVREAAQVAYDWLASQDGVDPERIVAFGRSMGGGSAADLALDRPVAALVLVSTFSSTMAMAAEMLAPGFLVRDRFSPESAVAQYEGPVLLMHGRRDEVIGFDHAERIAAAREGLSIVEIPCGHNDCGAVWNQISADIAEYLRTIGILTGVDEE